MPERAKSPNELLGEKCKLRPWEARDVESLVHHANNPKIWRNLYDYFPHPYRLEDAQNWVSEQMAKEPPYRDFAIDRRGEAIGSISLRTPRESNTSCLTVGYWIGEAYWGLGLATDALRTIIPYAFAAFDVPRLEAFTYEWNTGSQRVLEGCGFTLEGKLRQRMLKDGKRTDQRVYGLLRTEVSFASIVADRVGS